MIFFVDDEFKKMQQVGSVAVIAVMCVRSRHGLSSCPARVRKRAYGQSNKIILLFSTYFSYQTQFYQSVEEFIKVTDDLVTFPGEDNALL